MQKFTEKEQIMRKLNNRKQNYAKITKSTNYA